MITIATKYSTSLKNVMAIYKRYGNSIYNDDISQLDHALQTVYSAEQDTSDVAILFAAFAHDLGQLIPDVPYRCQFGIIDHHKLGAEYLLNQGFKHKICDLIELHTDAKRYLATTNREYFDKLSDISVLIMDHQGGLMNQKEEERFLKNPLALQAIQLRTWDDLARDPDALTRDLDYYEKLFAENVLDLMQ